MDNIEDNPQSGLPQTPKILPHLDALPSQMSDPAAQPISYWIKKFFACNPFYLVSAALLLYGLSLVACDGGFLRRELYQLIFNFSALQAYELLLVATAIILARRRIWYDSLLLVGLENLLVLVPFILISQAALLNQRLVWIICLEGGIAALGRFWGLKHFLKELNLPRRALVCGFMLLLINFALPLIFHHLNDSKIGTKPTEGAAYEMNRFSWLLLLPAMFALVHLLPRPRRLGVLLPQRAWLPTGMFLLWAAASGAHLFSLSYVYNFDWEPVFKAPLIWVVMWSVYLRHLDFVAKPVPLLSKILLALPVCATLFGFGGADNPVFVALTICNLAGYTMVLVKDRGNRTALHLLLVSAVALVAALWHPHDNGSPAGFGGYKWIFLSAVVYVLGWTFRSRNPKVGLLGALITGIGSLLLLPESCAVNCALQLTAAFLLSHSLRWDDEAHSGAQVFRVFTCAFWLLHGLFLVHTQSEFALPLVYGTGELLLLIGLLKKMLGGDWKPIVVPISATLVLFLQLGDFLALQLQSAPAGVLAVAGSFMLFALGTLAALTKSRWNAPPVSPALPAATNPLH